MSTNGTGMLPGDTPNTVPTLQDTADTGSLRDIARKSTDFSVRNNKVVREFKSYYKARRYADLKLVEMFASLVNLYAQAFAMYWTNFKRVSDSYSPAGSDTIAGQTYLARVYISHWMLDLYTVVRNSVRKLSSVAFAQHYKNGIELFSREYDTFLCHLLDTIRPTHVVGCHEDQMFIPKFVDEFIMLTKDPFGINDFAYHQRAFHAILATIKDKRVGWKTTTISNEAVGRPLWLFDWHTDTRVCSWFPREGNYTSEDVMFAFVIGVACTPKLAHVDYDVWTRVPLEVNLATPGMLSLYSRRTPRRYFGNYEVDSYQDFKEEFEIPPDEETLIAAHRAATTGKRGAKRTRTNPPEKDKSQPTPKGKGPAQDVTMGETLNLRFIRHRTHVYYARVISKMTDEARLNTLLGILVGPDTFIVY